MSVPPDRMAVRNPGPMKDPNKIMGLPKWAFFVIIAIGLVIAWYVWKRSQSSNAASLQTANAGAQPDTTNGVTAADIGGTPADNSFATQTDETALEEQIQAMQNSLFQLQQSNGGNGAGVSTTSPGGSPVPSGQNITTSTPGPIAEINPGIANSPPVTSGLPISEVNPVVSSPPQYWLPPIPGTGTSTTGTGSVPPVESPPVSLPVANVNTQPFGNVPPPYVPRLGAPVAS